MAGAEWTGKASIVSGCRRIGYGGGGLRAGFGGTGRNNGSALRASGARFMSAQIVAALTATSWTKFAATNTSDHPPERKDRQRDEQEPEPYNYEEVQDRRHHGRGFLTRKYGAPQAPVRQDTPSRRQWQRKCIHVLAGDQIEKGPLLFELFGLGAPSIDLNAGDIHSVNLLVISRNIAMKLQRSAIKPDLPEVVVDIIGPEPVIGIANESPAIIARHQCRRYCKNSDYRQSGQIAQPPALQEEERCCCPNESNYWKKGSVGRKIMFDGNRHFQSSRDDGALFAALQNERRMAISLPRRGQKGTRDRDSFFRHDGSHATSVYRAVALKSITKLDL